MAELSNQKSQQDVKIEELIKKINEMESKISNHKEMDVIIHDVPNTDTQDIKIKLEEDDSVSLYKAVDNTEIIMEEKSTSLDAIIQEIESNVEADDLKVYNTEIKIEDKKSFLENDYDLNEDYCDTMSELDADEESNEEFYDNMSMKV